MKTKPILNLETDPTALPAGGSRTGAWGMVAIFQNVLLPHLVTGLGLLAVSVYVGYSVWVAPFHLSGKISAFLVGLLAIFYGGLLLGYSLLAAGTFALYEACAVWEDFIDDLLDAVRQRALAKLEDMDESLAKDQAKVLIRGSVREVISTVRRNEFSSWPRGLVVLCLGGLTLALRSVLVARIIKWSGRTIKLSKIFAGKATLVGAIFLNLRFFALLLLSVVYGIGGMFLLFQGCLFWWGK